MLTVEDLYTLESVTDGTWGRSSTQRSGSPQWSVTFRMSADDKLKISYNTIVNLGHQNEIHSRIKQLEANAMKIINEEIKQIKRDFKSAAGHALKLKLADHHTSVEYISMSAYSPRKTAYFRVTAFADVG